MRVPAWSFLWLPALLATCGFQTGSAFIVPEELVSFLSIVYSNIPPIRKGTDSRVGVGFRLGPHADAQIILELGPQGATRPLGAASGFTGAGIDSRKRHTPYDPLQPLEGNAAPLPLPVSGSSASSASASNWLTNWRTNMVLGQASQGPAPAPALAARPSPSIASEDIPVADQDDLTAPAAFADPTKLSGEPLVSHLRQLYRKDKDINKGKATEAKSLSAASSGRSEPALQSQAAMKVSKSKIRSKPLGLAKLPPKPPNLNEDLSDVSLD